MDIPLVHPALRMRARIGDLENFQVVEHEALHTRGICAIKSLEHAGSKRRTVTVTLVTRFAVEEKIDRDPEWPGVLGAHVPTDIFHRKHVLSQQIDASFMLCQATRVSSCGSTVWTT